MHVYKLRKGDNDTFSPVETKSASFYAYAEKCCSAVQVPGNQLVAWKCLHQSCGYHYGRSKVPYLRNFLV